MTADTLKPYTRAGHQPVETAYELDKWGNVVIGHDVFPPAAAIRMARWILAHVKEQ